MTMKKNRKNLRIAMIAPPWLALPVKGYGGIEMVMQGLIRSLAKKDVEIVLYGNGARKMRGVSTKFLYNTDQYEHIHKPVFESIPILCAHVQFAINDIINDGKFDVVHDHTEFVGPQMLAWASERNDMPPVVHTIHGPPFSSKRTIAEGIPDNRPHWVELAHRMGKMYLVGISDALMEPAPAELRKYILPTVYNAIDTSQFPFIAQKKNYYFTFARFTRDKAQHVAAKICAKKGYRLRMGGTVAGIESSRKLMLELANPMSKFRSTPDFKYYSDEILPYVLRYPKITYSGNMKGAKKMKFMAEGKALLFPIDWEEPFGMAVIEALACGTPVIAMRRGAMPEIIQHGVNGFLADTEEEFAEYMERVDEIDPAVCRKSVQDLFTADRMADKYIDRYNEAIKRSLSYTGSV
jgi:glycosyltransferase involved in cell wall biosynthesis